MGSYFFEEGGVLGGDALVELMETNPMPIGAIVVKMGF
jgi:hypothetical protein